MNTLKIAVVFGGASEERNVSIASGLQVIRALQQKGHDVLGIDTAKGLLSEAQVNQLENFQILEKLPEHQELAEIKSSTALNLFNQRDLDQVDVVFIALHGGSGEDGSVQAMLETASIPFTGSGRVGSTLAMDKDIAKRLMLAAGIPTAEWIMCSGPSNQIENPFDFPVIVKPNAQGSTVGLSLVKQSVDLAAAIQKAGQFGDEVMIERYIGGRELTVGVLDDRALAVGEIIVKSEIFDYSSKYQPGAAQEIFPADLSDSQAQRIQELGLKVHKTLKLEGFSRVDFRMDNNGGLWVLEANTVPGLTRMSLLPQSARAAGIGFSDLCDEICRSAVAKFSKPKGCQE
ncbi:MAG: D-alanine-D-alanine ligase [Gammaproteobacteria bacterium]|jgi:D-alanine-D-alanine ligase